ASEIAPGPSRVLDACSRRAPPILGFLDRRGEPAAAPLAHTRLDDDEESLRKSRKLRDSLNSLMLRCARMRFSLLIVTKGRTDSLAAALACAAEALPARAEMIVIDGDPSCSAQPVTDALR